MGTKFPMRNIAPPVLLWHVFASRRIQGIENSAAELLRLTTDKQYDVLFGVVEEAVRDACSGWKRHQVTLHHRMNVPIDPRVNLTCQDVNEFLLFPYRGSPRGKHL